MRAPETDVSVATERGLRLYVCGKQKPRGRWIRLIDEDLDIDAAMHLAAVSLGEHVEVGVFVHATSGGGGLLYWTSATPDLSNSVVLRAGYSA